MRPQSKPNFENFPQEILVLNVVIAFLRNAKNSVGFFHSAGLVSEQGIYDLLVVNCVLRP